MKTLLNLVLFVCVSLQAHGGLVGVLSTESAGLVSGGKTWGSGGEGLTVSWMVSRNDDGTWHYEYSFSNAGGGTLKMEVSHFIISVSDNLTPSDVFNFGGDVQDTELRTFGDEPSNPGFPAGRSMYGLKIDLKGEQAAAAFDSVRVPMWGDFYAKGGGNPKNYACNSDLGAAVANPHDYLAAPIDADGNPLFKILVPDTHSDVPEPAMLTMLGLGALALIHKKPVQEVTACL